MAEGLQIWDDAGNLVWDTNMFIGRYLGAAQIGTGTGVITDARFTQGVGWCVPVLEGTSPINTLSNGTGTLDMNLWLSAPSFSFSGSQLVWSRAGNFPSGWVAPSCVLYYGIR
jgi:hypothetical protein